jgi:hypothetical protein
MALLLCTAAAFAAPPTPDAAYQPAEKPSESAALPDPVYINVGGDTIVSATPILLLPYSDSGNTCLYVNDYDAICPFSGSTARDVVYRFSPAAPCTIDVSLCTSLYDTKVYIFDNVVNNTIACNDDACGSDGWKSELNCVPLQGGHNYYIVVDGYSTSCGTYYLDVDYCVPCVVPCPPGALAEGEVDCYDNYDDYYNGGCNSTPNVFTNIPCDATGAGVTVCGSYGVFNHYSGFTYRDTDWYHLDPLANNGTIVWCVTGEYETLSGYLNAALRCGAPVFMDYQVTNPCDTACFNLPVGDLWLFVSTADWDLVGMPCGGNYTMTLAGYDCPPVSVEPTNWSKIKADYHH